MFGSNEIAGQKTFKEAPLNSLHVASIYGPTIIGTGPHAGRVGMVIRLAKCNLACSFCDTYFDRGEWLTFEEISARIDTLMQGDFHKTGGLSWKREHLVLLVTGGEPTLQPNLTGFLHTNASLWKEIQVESNGLIERTLPLGVTLVVSPKVRELVGPLNPGGTSRYMKPLSSVLQRVDYLKFLLDSDDRSSYYSIPLWGHANPDQVFIEPMVHYRQSVRSQLIPEAMNMVALGCQESPSFWDDGILDEERTRANHEYAAQFCIKWGFRLSVRHNLLAALP